MAAAWQTASQVHSKLYQSQYKQPMHTTEANIGILFITIGIVWLAINILRPFWLGLIPAWWGGIYKILLVRSRISHAICATGCLLLGFYLLDLIPSKFTAPLTVLMMIAYIAAFALDLFERKKSVLAEKKLDKIFMNLFPPKTKKDKYNHVHNESRHSKFRKK